MAGGAGLLGAGAAGFDWFAAVAVGQTGKPGDCSRPEAVDRSGQLSARLNAHKKVIERRFRRHFPIFDHPLQHPLHDVECLQ